MGAPVQEAPQAAPSAEIRRPSSPATTAADLALHHAKTSVLLASSGWGSTKPLGMMIGGSGLHRSEPWSSGSHPSASRNEPFDNGGDNSYDPPPEPSKSEMVGPQNRKDEKD